MGSDWLHRSVDRRRFLIGGAVGTGALALAACGAGAAGGGSGQAGSSASANLSLSSWNNSSDLAWFKTFADQYHTAHPGVSLDVQVTPATNFDEWFGTHLAGGTAPDIIRVQYQQAGRYIQNGGLRNIASYLPADYGNAFLPSLWASVVYKNGIYGIPEETDTFGTYYRADMLQQLGVTPPTTLANAWQWDEFLSIARKVKSLTGKYAIGFGYAGANTAYRWLPLLYMHGGQLLDSDGKTPAIESPQGVSALTWTQNLYKEGLIPPNNTIKGSVSTTARQYFIDGVVGMMLHGDWQMQSLQTALKDNQWGVTYMIRDSGRASDLGGNLLAVTKDCKNVAAAVDVLQFVCNQANTQSFVTQNMYIPVLKSLSGKPLQYAYRPDVMQRFAEQATTVPSNMAKLETSAQFADVNLMLADQLDLCFTQQQTPAATATNIAAGLKRILT
jgi:ABC-type glycerol-3-phosphate transport system substrate-binding protein